MGEGLVGISGQSLQSQATNVLEPAESTPPSPQNLLDSAHLQQEAISEVSLSIFLTLSLTSPPYSARNTHSDHTNTTDGG